MKRFLLFSFPEFYPSGGFEDFVECFDTIEDAKEYHESHNVDYYKEIYHIYDLELKKIIYKNYNA